MKLRNLVILLILILLTLGAFTASSCKLLFKSDFAELKVEDLNVWADSLPDRQKHMLAENEQQRKQFITQLKQAFSLAQAAEDEGLDKTDKFKQRMALSLDQMVAAEFSNRNPDLVIPKEESDAYFSAHQDAFENDLKLVNEGRNQQPTDEQREMLKTQWAEMKIRAEKGRAAGIENEPGFKAQIKFNRANLLANMYSQSVEEKLKLTDEEKKKYIAEHPEADLEKVREKAQGLLDRVKKGESFEKIADEINDDGTRGRGGDLDWFTKGKMDPDFEKAAFALGKGQISNELVKSSFGYHIIKVDDRRKAAPPPPPPAAAAGTPSASPSASPTPGEPEEEIHARHIYLSTQEADTFEERLIGEKVKRELEDATLKFPVNAPADFQVKVAGLNPGRRPGLGGGMGGQMKGIDPNENK